MNNSTTAQEIARAEANADFDWKIAVLRIIRRLAENCAQFTVMDVRSCLESEPATTHTLAALGPAMLKAKKEGWIDKQGQVLDGYDRAHSPITVWRSLLHKE